MTFKDPVGTNLPVVGSHSSAVDVFEARMPTAVILDDTVAGGRGWEYVRANIRGSELLRIPVHACGLEPGGDRGGVLDLTYLLKPLQAAELADELGRRNLAAP
jgi:hypothetical protein